MRDRSMLVGAVSSLVAFCTIGLTVGHDMPAVGAVLGSLVSVVVVGVVVRALKHHRVARHLHQSSMPGRLAGFPVRMGDLGDAAFVAGVARPSIFCDRRLLARLTPRELGAVMLHERAHQRANDPARLLLVELVSPLLRQSEWGRQSLAWMLARREIAADRYALAHGASRRDLASALLRLPPLAQAHVAGFTPAVDIRLHALLGRQPQHTVSAFARRGVPMLTGGLAGAAICTWVLHELLATVGLVCC